MIFCAPKASIELRHEIDTADISEGFPANVESSPGIESDLLHAFWWRLSHARAIVPLQTWQWRRFEVWPLICALNPFLLV